MEIPSLTPVVKRNLIGFDEIGIFYDYTDQCNAKSIEIYEAYKFIINKYRKIQIENTFLTIARTLKAHADYPILMGCYYMRVLEENEVEVLNLINEIKKHKKDSYYLRGYVSVLKVAHQLIAMGKKIDLPKQSETKTPDIIVKKRFGRKIEIDVKQRGIYQMEYLIKKYINEIINPNNRIEPISINASAEDEIKKTRLINVIKDGFEQADTLIIDESFNLAGIGGLFIANEIKPNKKIFKSIKVKRNRLIFMSHLCGKFNFISINMKKTLKKKLFN